MKKILLAIFLLLGFYAFAQQGQPKKPATSQRQGQATASSPKPQVLKIEKFSFDYLSDLLEVNGHYNNGRNLLLRKLQDGKVYLSFEIGVKSFKYQRYIDTSKSFIVDRRNVYNEKTDKEYTYKMFYYYTDVSDSFVVFYSFYPLSGFLDGSYKNWKIHPNTPGICFFVVSGNEEIVIYPRLR